MIERNSFYTRANFRNPGSPCEPDPSRVIARHDAEQGSALLLKALQDYAAKYHPGALG